MHVADLFPTLLRLAGLKLDKNLNLDGVDQWNLINGGGPEQRKEVINLDNVLGFGMYIRNQYKLVNGTLVNGAFDGWLSPETPKDSNIDPITYAINVLNSTTSRAILANQKKNRLGIDKILELRREATVKCGCQLKKNACDLTKAPCLFNINEDPCEQNNLANKEHSMLNVMLKKFNEAIDSAVPSRRRFADPASDPKYFNFNWQWWEADS